MGQSSEDLVERVQWTFPIVFSHHDPDVLYTGTQKVWKTTTEGQSWEQLSPDLTRADAMTIGPSGGPITKDQTGVETYATVFAIAPSYHDAEVIWAGSDDGLVHVTRDGGLNWATSRRPTHRTSCASTPSKRRPTRRARHTCPASATSWTTTAAPTSGRRTTTARRGRASSAACRPTTSSAPPARIRRARPALRGVGAHRVRFLRRRGNVAAAVPQPARGPGVRPGRRGERPRDRDPRPVILGAREHRTATPAERPGVGGRFVALRSRGSDPGAWTSAPHSSTTLPKTPRA